jgi:hypothetical protein
MYCTMVVFKRPRIRSQSLQLNKQKVFESPSVESQADEGGGIQLPKRRLGLYQMYFS